MENRKPMLEVNGCIEEPLTTFDLELRALIKEGPPGITMSLSSPGIYLWQETKECFSHKMNRLD